MHKAPYVFPIIGGRKVEHLLQNLEALEISLTDEQIRELENVVPFQHGFPAWMIVSSYPEYVNCLNLIMQQGIGDDIPNMLKSVAVIDRQPAAGVIRPKKEDQ